jgi:flagellar L-ring protein precursor FlgH
MKMHSACLRGSRTPSPATLFAATVLLAALGRSSDAAAIDLLGKKQGNGAAAAPAKATPPEEALKAYIQRVHTQHETEVRTPGSIWVDQGRLVRLSTDAKAVRLHDVVSIVVAESVAAETDGQVKNSRASNASSGFTGLFGALGASNRLQNLLGQNAASGLSAQGQSVTNSSLATTFGGEVVDVLPNGMLVVQATRQLTF